MEANDFIFVGDAYSIAKNPERPCEDAFFITDLGLGVSDGVGSWTNYGIDPSLFSKSLMQECSKFLKRVESRLFQSSVDKKLQIQELECHRQALESKIRVKLMRLWV